MGADTPAEDEAPEVEAEEVKDLDTPDEDDVKGGFRSAGCRF